MQTQLKKLRRLAATAKRRLTLHSGVSPTPSTGSEFHHDSLRCTISYNKYGGYCVPLSSRHRPAAKKILTGDIWEPETIEFIVSNCGDGDVVHAGTYFGDFLPALSKGCSEGSRVWAFEPNSENYRCAKITVEMNDLSNIELLRAGLGAQEDRMFVRTEDIDGVSLGGESQIVTGSDKEGKGLEETRIVAVDDVLDSDRKVTIVQLDVEGYEQPALAGALQTIRRWRPIIIIEVWDSPLLESTWFNENVLALGYRRADNVNENSVFLPRL